MTSGRLIIPITGALETPTDPTIPAEPPPDLNGASHGPTGAAHDTGGTT